MIELLKRFLLLACLAGAYGQTASAAPPAATVQTTTDDSLYIFRFVQAKDEFYVPWRNNGARLEQLVTLLKQHKEGIISGHIALRVDGYCTGQPSHRKNLRIAALRSNRVKSEIITRTGLREENFTTANHTDIYKGEQDVVTVTVRIPAKTKDSFDVEAREAFDTDDTGDTHLKAARTEPATAQHPTQQPKSASSASSASEKSPDRHPPFSLRANLLRWATLTPDLGLEWHATPRISLLLNASWTSWRWNNKDRRYALWNLSPEVRHYLGTARRGYLGLMYHTGRFNYKLTATGRQGNYHGGGITGGYLWMFRPAWGIDFHLAAGYTRAEYDTYTLASTGVLVFKERNASRNYWGINNAAITLIWKIGGNKQ